MNVALTSNRQRGAAALVVTALLFFAMLLVVAAANRSVLVEAQTSANQYRSAQAFEAAEAGLEWTVAKLNDGTRLGDDCLPSDDADAASFRDRHLRFDSGLASLTPLTWDDSGTARPLQATCVRGDAGWSCRCPATGAAAVPPVTGAATAPTFTVELSPGAQPGLIVAVATGCTSSAAPCSATSDVSHEAAARVGVSLGLLPGLRSPPAAALTASGDVMRAQRRSACTIPTPPSATPPSMPAATSPAVLCVSTAPPARPSTRRSCQATRRSPDRCIVTPRADGRWSGRTTLSPSGWTIGGSAADRRVCRFAADRDGSGAIDANIEHPSDYRDVSSSLTEQNFLVVRGNQACPGPSGDVSTLAASLATVQHQP